MSERIVAAAARTPDGVVHFLPAPARHHHILQADSTPDDFYADQGFATSEGRFVDREEGMKVAVAAGQLKRSSNPKHYQGPLLFSEDLW